MADIATTGIQVPAVIEAWVRNVMIEVEAVDSEQVSLDIAARLLSANSVDAILAPQAAQHARDWLKTPLTIHGVKFQAGAFEGLGFFAVVDCEEPFQDQRFPISCGGTNVMAQLYKLRQLGAFPIRAMFVETERPTSAGYRPLWLQAAPA